MFDENQITLEEVNKVLSEIENKYSQVRCSSVDDEFDENLGVLSKEFDSLGVQSIDLSKPFSQVFKQVVSSARSLVQIHRKTLSQMKDVNINIQSKNSQSGYLNKVVEGCHSKINYYKDKTGLLQNRILVLESEVNEHKNRESEIKKEIDKVKRHCNSQNNEYSRRIRKLTEENKRLKGLLGADTHIHSKDETLLKYIGKFKRTEEVYKNTIHKLQENNQHLLNEILDMKTSQNLENI